MILLGMDSCNLLQIQSIEIEDEKLLGNKWVLNTRERQWSLYNRMDKTETQG